jgi:Ras-related protein Rab-7A
VGPSYFFTSAKTGAGVSEVFAYVARRVIMRREWEEEAVYVDVPDFDGDNSTISGVA